MAVKAIAENASKSLPGLRFNTRVVQSKAQRQARAAEPSARLSSLITRSSDQITSVESDRSSDALQCVARPATIQPRLEIGAVDDPLEREADRVADNVISLSPPDSSGVSEGPSPAQKSLANGSVARALAKPLQTLPISGRINRLARQTTAEPEQDEAFEELQNKPLLQRAFMDLGDDPSANGALMARRVQASGAGETRAAPDFENRLNASKGGGSSLPDATRAQMESGIGADFSSVRIHTDSNAAQMNQQINARAFTHGGDVYFNQGQYQPQSRSGQHLIAHELTHTLQQGASTQSMAQKKAQPGIGRAPAGRTQPKVQRGWLGDAWDAVSSAASAVVEWTADQLNEALNWARDQFADFVQEIPGYKLMSVVLGQDPIRGNPVARNGRNFIEAGLDIIPFGSDYQRKLEETGAMEEAATWLDAAMAKVDISLGSILAGMSRFWDSLSVTDLGDVPGVLNRAANIIRHPVSQVITFATNLAAKLLEIVKNAVLSALVGFIRDHTRGYPLLTVILGQDPITEELVERNGMNLIRGFMLLSESGEEQLRQMEETGSLQRAADWIDGAVARLDLSWESIQGMFARAWDLVSISSLMNPIGAFTELANIFLEPAGRILRFLVEVALKILQLIKDALIARLVAYARGVRGYPLITVILGRDPFSGDPVLRTTENIIHGFMSLMEGGEEQFQQMKSTGAIGRLSARVEAAIERLNFTWDFIRNLFMTTWESFSLADLAAPFEAFARILGVFASPILRLVAFVWEIVKIVIEVLMVMMSFPIDLINNIITRAMQAIDDIKRDPIGFLKNLLRAVKEGFVRFFDNILTHLLNGVTDWLFGELGDAGITPPADFSLSSILNLVLEILGITVERIWSKLAEKIGQDKVDRVRGMIDRLTGIWSFVRDVTQRGVVAIWEYIQEKLNNLWDIVLDSIRNWIVTRIITQVTTKLLSMLDPTGIMAVINGFIAFYNAVQSFIRYLREMLEIVNSFVVGVAELARGDVSKAAGFLEGALAQGIPIAIGFLANQVGLSGLGRRISEMIERVREMVDQGLDWLIDKAVNAGSALLNMGRAAVGAVRNWWQSRKQFNAADGASHDLYFPSESGELTVESTPTPVGQYLNALVISDSDPQKAQKQGHKTQALQVLAQINTIRQTLNQSAEGNSELEAQLDQKVNQLAAHLTPLMVGSASGGRIPEPLTLEALQQQPVAMPRSPEEETIDLDAAQQIVLLAATADADTLALSQRFDAIKTRFALQSVAYVAEGNVYKLRLSASQHRDVNIALPIKDQTPGIVLTSNIDNTPGSAGGDTVSTAMTADPVGPDKIGQGSEPASSALSTVMSKLITDPGQPNPSKFIKGHLLNHHIGGPGTGQNMFPITAQANKTHNTSIEERVKSWVQASRYWVYYQVNVSGISETIPHPQHKHPDNFINSSFVCKAYIRHTDGQEHDPIHVSVPSVYVRGDAVASSAEPAYQLDQSLKTALDGLTAAQRSAQNLGEEINFAGFGPGRAQVLVEAYNKYSMGDLNAEWAADPAKKSSLTFINNNAATLAAAIGAIAAAED